MKPGDLVRITRRMFVPPVELTVLVTSVIHVPGHGEGIVFIHEGAVKSLLPAQGFDFVEVISESR